MSRAHSVPSEHEPFPPFGPRENCSAGGTSPVRQQRLFRRNFCGVSRGHFRRSTVMMALVFVEAFNSSRHPLFEVGGGPENEEISGEIEAVGRSRRGSEITNSPS